MATQAKHPPRGGRRAGAVPGERRLAALAGFFRVLGDPTRLTIIRILSGGGLCVNEIAVAAGMHQSAISHQLRILKQARLVKSRRDGRSVCYSLDDGHVELVFRQGLAHVAEQVREP